MDKFYHSGYIKSKIQSLYSENSLELDTRKTNISLLLKLSQKLRLPCCTRSTTFYLYHRFSIQYPMSNNNTPLFIALISLSCKIQETVKKLRDIYTACQGLFDELKEYMDLKESIIHYELLIQQVLDFNLKIDLPYRFVLRFCHELGGDQNLGARAWDIVSRSYYTNVCLQAPPHVIAFSALYLASYVEDSISIRSKLGAQYHIEPSDIHSISFEIIEYLLMDEFYSQDPVMARVFNDLKRELFTKR